jgi:hypothetical protein
LIKNIAKKYIDGDAGQNHRHKKYEPHKTHATPGMMDDQGQAQA